MPLRVLLVSPDRHISYDGRTPDATGVGGGITARLSLLAALAAMGHTVTAYVNCAEPLEHQGVRYEPIDRLERMDADVLIAMTTGGALSFASLRGISIQASLRVVWAQGVPKPADLDVVAPDYVCVASNFLRDVCVERWGLAPRRLFVCYNGLHQGRFEQAERSGVVRDPFALAYIGPPDKGLDASVAVLQRLRARDERYHLDVFGGSALWGGSDQLASVPPGVAFRGLVAQEALVPLLFRYEYCLAPQAIEEGFGIGVQEAKRAGQIVLASDVGAFHELFRSSWDGFLVRQPHVSDASHDAMANRILELAHDPARRERIRRRAQRTPWDWDLAARTWTAWWEDVLGRQRAPRVAGSDGEAMLALPDGRHSAETGLYVPDVYPASPILDRLGQTNRLLVGGYYGHGNLGDETILHAMLEELREALPNVSAVVASGDPEATRRVHDVDAVDERDIRGLVDAAAASDLVVLGGGGLFQDYHGVDPATLLTPLHWGLTYFNAFPALAILTGKPFMLYAVGVGPLGTPEGRRYTQLAFERADGATVRDTESLELLAAIGAPIEDARVAADPAFLIEPAPADHVDVLLRELGFVKRPSCLVAVVLREWDSQEAGWMGAVAEALDRFVETHDASLLLIPFQSHATGAGTDDRAASERVRGRMRHADRATICRVPLDAVEVSGVFGACDLVLAVRLHATILAACAGTPMVALAYDPKVATTMSRIGLQEFSMALSETTADRLIERLDACYRERSALRATLDASVPKLRAAAAASTAQVVALLERRAFRPRPVSPGWHEVLRGSMVWQIRQAAALQAQAMRLEAERERAQARVPQLMAEGEQARARIAQLVSDGDATSRMCAELSDALASANRERLSEVASLAQGLKAPAPGGAAAADALEAELRTIHGSRAWRTIMAYRRARRAIENAVRHPKAQTTRAVKATVKPSARDRIRRAVGRRVMNPYAYVFDLYRRARSSIYGAHVAGVQAPGGHGLVSIVLPVYNGGAMIAEAVESVLGQTYSNFELIVIDDGSTDDTPTILEEYGRRDPRVRIIRQENQKLPRALSRGFREARGEFLTWTSCDNRLKPACLEKLVGSLRRHPCWDMVYANLDLIGERGEYLHGSEHYEGYQRPHGSEHVHLPESTAELNVWPNNSIGAAFLYRNRVAVLLGDYSATRFVSEDYDYWMRVNALLTLRHADFDEPVYDYRFHARSLTSRWAELKMLENRERLMVFEDFRRDFYLSPMVWIVDGDQAQATALAREIRARGHLVYEGEYALEAVPRLFVPVVYVLMVDAVQAATGPKVDLPPQALKVLVTADVVLPDCTAPEWDLCCVVGSPPTLPHLERPYQGWLAAADVAALVHAVDIRARSESLARIEAETEAPRPDAYAASVIICTHRCGPRIVAAIRSVLLQQFERPFELLLVNNAPSNRDIDDAVTALRAEFPAHVSARLRVVVCPIVGLSAARNAGLAEAASDIVCFLDDDAVADARWLARLWEAFEAHPDAGVIGGHIHLKIPEPRPRALRPGWEKYWSHFVTGFEDYTVVRNWWEFPWGANWAARRSALLLAGGFRSRYGRVGDNAWGGEELVAAALVRRLGYSIAVLPQASVVHDVDPARFTFLHVLRTLVAGHQVAYLAQRDLYVPRESGLRSTLWQIFTQHVDPSIPSHERRWRNVAYRKFAQVRLLFAQLRDMRRRLRKAIVVTEPCEGA